MHGDEGENCTKRAVALRYNREKEAAPRVVAKGVGTVAENIVTAAVNHAVPVYAAPQLVRQLMPLEIDQVIPPALYQVVAEVLAYVYRLDRRVGNKTGIGGREKDGGL